MFYAFLIAFLSGLILNFFFIFLGKKITFFKLRLRDKEKGISKLGGIAIAFSFFIAIEYSGLVNRDITVFLTAIALTFLLGLMDDLWNLSPLKKLSLQLIISIFLVASGIKTQVIFLHPFLNTLLSVFWFLAIMNAFNFLDILDGLAAGIAVLCAATFFYIAYVTSNMLLGIVSAALLGSNLSFLKFNFAPARLYMGDTGSLFNGIALAMIALMMSYAKPGHEMALFVPLLVLALPLYDLVFVVLMRWRSHKPIIKKSRDHFALRLVDNGRHPNKIVFLMYFFNILFNLAAVLLLLSSNTFGFLLLFLTFCAWSIVAYKIG